MGGVSNKIGLHRTLRATLSSLLAVVLVASGIFCALPYNADATVYPTGTLKVTKVVDGDMSDPDKAFEFTVTLKNGYTQDPIDDVTIFYGNDENNAQTVRTDSNGQATIPLKNGESLWTNAIGGTYNEPYYTVEEKDYSAEGYIFSWSKIDGDQPTATGERSASGQLFKAEGGRKGRVELTATNTLMTPESPSITTRVKEKTIKAMSNQKIIDTVIYSGLKEGEIYNLEGTLVDDTEKELGFTAKQEFTAEGSEGSIDVEFTGVDASGMKAGDKIIVFETLVDKDGNNIAEHKDVNDEQQTVTVEEADDNTPENEPDKDTPSEDTPKDDTDKETDKVTDNDTPKDTPSVDNNSGDDTLNEGTQPGSSGDDQDVENVVNEEQTSKSSGRSTKGVNTGDNAPIAGAIVALIAAGGALVAIRRRRAN